MNYRTMKTVDLSNGIKISGYEGEYVFGKIIQSQDFYERDMLEKWFLGDKIKVVYDIGANIGNHTLYFGMVASQAQIFSFEPIPENFTILTKNISSNALEKRVQAFQLALGEKSGSVHMNIVQDNNLGSAKIISNDETSYLYTAKMAAVDDLKLPPPDFVKIDVEGFELSVLKGMVNTLKNLDNAIIWIEVSDENIEKVYEFMAMLGFSVSDFSLELNNNIIWTKGEKILDVKDIYKNFLNQIAIIRGSLVASNKKYRDYTQIHNKLKEQYTHMETQHIQLQHLNEQYADEIAQGAETIVEVISVLENLKNIVAKQQSQIHYLTQENKEYKRKLSIITDSWYGKIMIKCYRILKKVVKI